MRTADTLGTVALLFIAMPGCASDANSNLAPPQASVSVSSSGSERPIQPDPPPAPEPAFVIASATEVVSAPLPAASGPIISKDEAIARAVATANVALDQSYAAFARTPGMVAPAHTTPWVSADRAIVEGPTAAGGYRLRWSLFPPAGFGYRAIVTVSKQGVVKIEAAEATFSPD